MPHKYKCSCESNVPHDFQCVSKAFPSMRYNLRQTADLVPVAPKKPVKIQQNAKKKNSKKRQKIRQKRVHADNFSRGKISVFIEDARATRSMLSMGSGGVASAPTAHRKHA